MKIHLVLAISSWAVWWTLSLGVTAGMSLIVFKLGRRYSLSVVKLLSSPPFDVHFYSLIKRGIYHCRRALAGRCWVLDHVIQGRKRKYQVGSGLAWWLIKGFIPTHVCPQRNQGAKEAFLADKWEQQQYPFSLDILVKIKRKDQREVSCPTGSSSIRPNLVNNGEGLGLGLDGFKHDYACLQQQKPPAQTKGSQNLSYLKHQIKIIISIHKPFLPKGQFFNLN